MIVSASYRTDIPAYYAEWFRRRLEAGFCRVRNPYGGKPSLVDLRAEAVEGYVFWTRNAAPFLNCLDAVAGQGVPFVLQYSLTAYPRALETAAPRAEQAVATIREIVNRFGPGTVVWRYDPVVATSLTPPEWHREKVAGLAEELSGLVDEVVFSYTQTYRKTARNLTRAGERRGFAWQDPPEEEKTALLADLARLARARGLTPTLCSQPAFLEASTMAPARCIDADRLSRLAGRALAAPTKGNRPGCLCARSRDIGAYDSCPQGCVYCYAVSDNKRAAAARSRHDPSGEFLI